MSAIITFDNLKGKKLRISYQRVPLPGNDSITTFEPFMTICELDLDIGFSKHDDNTIQHNFLIEIEEKE